MENNDPPFDHNYQYLSRSLRQPSTQYFYADVESTNYPEQQKELCYQDQLCLERKESPISELVLHFPTRLPFIDFTFPLPSTIQEKETLTRVLVKDLAKDSLKFARRLSRDFINLFQTRPNSFIQPFLNSALEILSIQAHNLQIRVKKISNLASIAHSLIEGVWRGFGKQLSSARNKKISKITKEIWDIPFCYRGFWDLIMSNATLNLKAHLESYSSEGFAAFEQFFKKIIYLAHRAITLVFLFYIKDQDTEYRSSISTFDNYRILAMFPDLYELYNHKKGVFADKCCGSCKICGSKKFLNKEASIEFALTTAQNFKDSLFQGIHTYLFEAQFDILEIFKFIQSMDSS